MPLSNGTIASFFGCPIKFEGNSLTFQPIIAEFSGQPDPNNADAAFSKILWIQFRGWRYPYLETILEAWVHDYQPSAVIIYHTGDDGAYAFACGCLLRLLVRCRQFWSRPIPAIGFVCHWK